MADMQEHGWRQGDRLDITSHMWNGKQDEIRTAASFLLVPYEIPRKCVASYFPECNVLVPITSVALGSNTPVSKAVVVTFAPSRVRNDAEANREHEHAVSG